MTDAVPDRIRTRFVVETVSKAFDGVQALRDVTLEVCGGEVFALVGENGAGKSTLLRILSGDLPPDTGHLTLDDRRIDLSGARDGRRSGVRVIHQEPEIIPHVSVAENVFVGALPRRGGFVDGRGLRRRLVEDLERYGFAQTITPDAIGDDLSPAQRQVVEILRAMTGDAKVIAFDEPTSSLSDYEVHALFTLIRRLRNDGMAIVYVSHRMNEIFALADRIGVLRDGHLVGIRSARETDENELVRMMVGRELSNVTMRQPRGPGPVLLSVRDLTTDQVSGINLDLRSGEIVALAGLVGSGRSEVAHALVGEARMRSGTIRMNGNPLRLRSPRDAVRAGIGFAPEDRKAQALLLERTVRDNISLAALDDLRRLRMVRRRQETVLARRFVSRLDIRTPSIEQKVVLARWLARRPKVLILDEPTRGVDVGAKAEMYSVVNDLAADGLAILLISSELPEVLGLADRIIVMQSGQIVGELSREEATEERILSIAISEYADKGSAG